MFVSELNTTNIECWSTFRVIVRNATYSATHRAWCVVVALSRKVFSFPGFHLSSSSPPLPPIPPCFPLHLHNLRSLRSSDPVGHRLVHSVRVLVLVLGLRRLASRVRLPSHEVRDASV